MSTRRRTPAVRVPDRCARQLRHAVRLSLVSTLACTALSALAAVAVAQGAKTTRRATGASTRIAKVQGFNSVRAYNDVQAWTTFSSGWRVVVRHAGHLSTPAAIPAGDQRLKVDVGPGPEGKPALAFVRCAKVCRVVVSDVDGRRARTVPGSAGASSATIWGTRVAWVKGRNTVLTRRLGVGGVTRLAGAPRRKCSGRGRVRCQRPTARSVDDLELHDQSLALIDSYDLAQAGLRSEVRLQSVRGGPQRLIALLNPGEDQQTWIGPSWAKGDLFFYKSCPLGCAGSSGAYRYDPGSGAYAHERVRRSIPISGFAMDDDARRAFEVLGLFGDRAGYTDVVTSLRLTRPLAFRRTRAPIEGP
ncbi:MAG TPA: hypothetical protein VMY78_11675 [Solirubrobacteraceae bacterium]|nr:hypothetical protein [Solirubrobacteraceae bacterium]